ncbi:MAG: hypothetical protein KDA83_18415 [Planctomycetales bacterium]|nr:hypothetical protein [Planctomycetales bacterium]
MPCLSVEPKVLAHFARVLDHASTEGVLDAKSLGELHREFLARDKSGNTWTVGLKTGAWNVVEAGRWVSRSTPPDRLELELDLFLRLNALPDEHRICPCCLDHQLRKHRYCTRCRFDFGP